MAAHQAGLSDVNQGRRHSRFRLLVPLRYLSIHNREKARYDFVLPGILGLGMWAFYALLEPKFAFFGEAGLLKYTRDMLVMAVPFMVGALATVSMANFGGHLDKRPLGGELFLDGRSLTLRQFVCYLLGYLCFISLVVLGMSVVAQLVQSNVIAWTAEHQVLRNAIRGVGALFFFLALASLIVTTFWALYFLTEIVNRPTPNMGSTKG